MVACTSFAVFFFFVQPNVSLRHGRKFDLITVRPCQQKRHKLKRTKENIHLAWRFLEFCLPLVQHSGVPVVSLFGVTLQLLFFFLFLNPLYMFHYNSPLQSYGPGTAVLVTLVVVQASEAACGLSCAFSMAVPYGSARLKKPSCKKKKKKHFRNTRNINENIIKLHYCCCIFSYHCSTDPV